jgi:hypothetical protein
MRTSILKTLGLSFLLLPSQVFAAAEKSSAMVLVADSRNLTGLRAWWANVYNDSHLYFALITVLAIPLAGIILGSLADFLMGRIGIDLKSRTLREN